jgi:hypothetical protein
LADHFLRAPGVIVEPVGNLWAAFGELKGSTHLLNIECAAILECLTSDRLVTAAEVFTALFPADPEEGQELVHRVVLGLETLVDAGLAIRSQPAPANVL